jgi:CBS domain-containing protein
MSMEQAILEHAGALRELAAAIKSTGVPFSSAMTIAPVTNGEVRKLKGTITEGDPIQAKAAELAEARTERVAATKEAAAQGAKANEKPLKSDAEIEAALDKIEQKAKDVAKVLGIDDTEQAALDYKKDVYPVLLQVSKIKGKEALRGLLDKFGAKTGDSLKADQFAAIVADGNALLAG